MALIVLLVGHVLGGTSPTHAQPILREGQRGPAVVLLQDLLFRQGVLTAQPDGLFGKETWRAVRLFQARHGLTVDGIVGPSTWQKLRGAGALPVSGSASTHVLRRGQTLSEVARQFGVSVRDIAVVNRIFDPNRVRAGTHLIIPTRRDRQRPELALWPEVNSLFPYGEIARVTDVVTGRSFRIRRFYGHQHADVEPLTRQDAQVLKEIYGGHWSWERRAIVLEIRGRYFAASMNGQPHGQGAVSANGFDGHFCIHLLGSRTHGTRRFDFEHHRRIMEAAGYRSEPVWLRN